MPDSRDGLRADRTRCAGLCCIVPGFAASADFAIDKPPGRACPNLLADHRCGIHDRLAERGFPGCVTFDCFGAGQQVVQVTFGGTVGADAGADVGVDDAVGRVFEVVRPLQELRWYLVEARERLAGRSGALAEEVEALDGRVAALVAAGPDVLAAVDTAAWRREDGDLLGRVSALVRGAAARSGARHAGSGGADSSPARSSRPRGAAPPSRSRRISVDPLAGPHRTVHGDAAHDQTNTGADVDHAGPRYRSADHGLSSPTGRRRPQSCLDS